MTTLSATATTTVKGFLAQGGVALQRDPPTADSVPWWGDDPDAWMAVYIAGQRLPGVCKVDTNCKIRHGNKKVPGLHGAVRPQYGYEPAEIRIECIIWMPGHIQTLESMMAVIRPQPGRGQPKPVSVVHPALNLIGVQDIEIVGLAPPKQREEGGDIYVFTVHALEYIPQAIAKKAKTGAPSLSNTPSVFPTFVPQQGGPLSSEPKPESQASVPPSHVSAGP